MPAGSGPEVDDLPAGHASVRVAFGADSPMRWAKNATIATTDQLVFVAQTSLSDGAHTATFEISDPFGNVYQRDEVPFDASESPVLDAMPVLGTWISQYDMRGRWGCRLYLDGDPTEAAHASFNLH
jgi:hypothetical protein